MVENRQETSKIKKIGKVLTRVADILFWKSLQFSDKSLIEKLQLHFLNLCSYFEIRSLRLDGC